MSCNLSCCFSPLLLSPTWKTEARLASTRCPCNEVVTVTGCERGSTNSPWCGRMDVCAPAPTTAHLGIHLDLAPSQGGSEKMWQKRWFFLHIFPTAVPRRERLAREWSQPDQTPAGSHPPERHRINHPPATTSSLPRQNELQQWGGGRLRAVSSQIPLPGRILCPAAGCAVSRQIPISFLRDRNLSFPVNHLPITGQGRGAHPRRGLP